MTNLALRFDEAFDESPEKAPEFKVLDASVGAGLMSEDEHLLFKNNAVQICAAESGAD